jgi:hypothetical protein
MFRRWLRSAVQLGYAAPSKIISPEDFFWIRKPKAKFRVLLRPPSLTGPSAGPSNCENKKVGYDEHPHACPPVVARTLVGFWDS